MFLTAEEQRMAAGERGPGMQRSMSLLVRYGELFGAERMVPVTQCHLSPDVPNDLLESMTEGVDKAATRCTLHPCLYPEAAEKMIRRPITPDDRIAEGYVTLDGQAYAARMARFRQLGFLPTSTCVPYLIGFVPRKGDVLCLTGSSGQVISNSVFGAKANREGHSSALASAITGVTPELGLLRDANRYAQVVFEVSQLDFSGFGIADFGALGYLVGSVAGTRNAALVGLPKRLTMEQCKYLMSPMPVSGGCALCHLVGITPEADTLEQALLGRVAEETVVVTPKDVDEVRQRLQTADGEAPDLVVLGCPHLTIGELELAAATLRNRQVRPGVRLLLATAAPIQRLAQEAGFVETITTAGGEFADICVSVGNPLAYLTGVKTVMTNSARAAHYVQRMTNWKVKIVYTDAGACLEAATSRRER
jgi:cis-L-3-hydroxyproline dehydratase